MTKIPSDEDFERARNLMRERYRNLDNVSENIIHHFKSVCPLHDFYILPQRDVSFRAYVFFEKDINIQESKNIGLNQKIIDLVYSELELAGRGKRDEITVAFEFDSDENVKAKYGGDYHSRLL